MGSRTRSALMAEMYAVRMSHVFTPETQNQRHQDMNSSVHTIHTLVYKVARWQCWS